MFKKDPNAFDEMYQKINECHFWRLRRDLRIDTALAKGVLTAGSIVMLTSPPAGQGLVCLSGVERNDNVSANITVDANEFDEIFIPTKDIEQIYHQAPSYETALDKENVFGSISVAGSGLSCATILTVVIICLLDVTRTISVRPLPYVLLGALSLFFGVLFVVSGVLSNRATRHFERRGGEWLHDTVIDEIDKEASLD